MKQRDKAPSIVENVYLEEVLRASLGAQPEDVLALGVVLGHLDHARVGERQRRLLQLCGTNSIDISNPLKI